MKERMNKGKDEWKDEYRKGWMKERINNGKNEGKDE